MKIKPVILCGGAGTRLWPKSKVNLPKQFIDFGGWTLFEKTLLRIKNPIFDAPIITTNESYLNLVKKYLSKYKFKKYSIIVEPLKKNTAPAIASTLVIEAIFHEDPMIFFPADHLIENTSKFYKSIKSNLKNLNDNDIFIFGIKPVLPSNQYGYFLTKNKSKNLNIVTKFIEKPNTHNAKKIIKKKGYWNSGILFATKGAIFNHFNKYAIETLSYCLHSYQKGKRYKQKAGAIISLNKKIFSKIKEGSFDYVILEKSKRINGIKLDMPWSDLGNWGEISKLYEKNKSKYFKKKNVFHRPWGKYVNLFKGKNFLVKELTIKSKSSISLQKHNHRSEHWRITSGKPRITINKKKFFKDVNETVFVPKGAIHRIENLFKTPVKIMEVQTGATLKETDIIRYKDIYGRVN